MKNRVVGRLWVQSRPTTSAFNAYPTHYTLPFNLFIFIKYICDAKSFKSCIYRKKDINICILLFCDVYGKVIYKRSRVKGQWFILSLSPFTEKNAIFYKTRELFS